MEVNYVLAHVAWESQQKWFLHLATAVPVVLVAAAGARAWYHGPAEDDQRRSQPVTATTTKIRSRWMSMAAVVCSAWFLLVILAMEVPVLIPGVCD